MTFTTENNDNGELSFSRAAKSDDEDNKDYFILYDTISEHDNEQGNNRSNSSNQGGIQSSEKSAEAKKVKDN